VKHALVQLVVTVVALFGGLWALWFVTAQYEEWRYIRPWERVSRGDTEEHVVALLGRPHRVINEHSDKGSWESDKGIEYFDAESVKSFRYVPFSITGEEYDVRFDSSGHVVSKYHITSP
jgi:hypothetical protein